MAVLKIRYFDQITKKMVEIEANADVVDISIPKQEHSPALVVTVNTDAILVHEQEKRLAMYDLSEIVSQADE